MTRTPLTLEDVATHPLPGTAVPGSFTFQNGKIAYLFSKDRSLTRQLYVFDPRTGEHSLLVLPPDEGVTEENISPEEALRRERRRQRELGITDYFWHRSGRILVPLNSGIYVQDGEGAHLRAVVTDTEFPVLSPRLSPDGGWVAYVQDAEISVVSAAGGEPRRITDGARGTGKTHGLAEYVVQEELSRYMGFWWSPDSKKIAFTEVDETNIPIYRIMHQGMDAVGEKAQEDHHYPFAGGPNARVRLGVVDRGGGDPVWMDLGHDEDIYLARVVWLPDGRLCVQILNREQSWLDLLVFDPQTGKGKKLLEERSDVWINLHNMFRPLQKQKEQDAPRDKVAGFIWASERSGFRHLYLLDDEGQLMRPLTGGEWQVDDIVGVDENAQVVYFLGTKESPLEKHLYAVSYAGSDPIAQEPRRITIEPGMHTAVIDPAFKTFIDTYNSVTQPPRVTLRRLSDGQLLHTIYDSSTRTPDPRLEGLLLPAPEFVTLKSRDGETLHGAIYHPPDNADSAPYPTLVYVYGGPHSQLVANCWQVTVNMRAQYLAQRGFLVFVLDNRGTSRRGLAFEAHLKHNMGDIEVRDQVDGVRWLVDQGLADPERVGVYGWSYGGYMTLMCLTRAPEIFKVGVAGAPVTNYDGYDTAYTERYMGLPQKNPVGYERSSVMAHVDKLEGKLLLIHGLIDENVHFRHTARLINALIKARKPYNLMILPDARHSPRNPADRIYLEGGIQDFFELNL
jgi:dipeptidyl-peptidase-4